MTARPHTVLLNARVLTLETDRRRADALAITGDRIAWIGSGRDLAGLTGRGVRTIDCRGRTLAPGFVDPHCHVLAYASSLLAVDCGPSAVTSIPDIKHAIRLRATTTPPGDWVRAAGYDETALREGRHPHRRDLDEAAPDHPVRLNHRSGHACVLNGLALERVGISAQTPDPPAGVIDRDAETGEPSGLLLEMDGYLDARVPALDASELERGVRIADRRLLSEGITSVQDATHTNTPERFGIFKRLKDSRRLRPRVTMMAGAGHLDRFLEEGLAAGAGDHALNVGAAKVMLTATSGSLQPSREALAESARRAHEAGFQVAIHAVEAEAVDAAVRALAPLGGSAGPSRHRIEHCSECPAELLDLVRRSGVTIVTQPSFIYHSGDRYLADVPREMHASLYPIASLLRAGVRVAAGSDAPVAPPGPLRGMYAAALRSSRAGRTVGEAERVSPWEALAMHTLGGAHAAHQEGDKGSIRAGKLADLVLLDTDPTSDDVERLADAGVTMTLIGGQVVWEA